MLVGVELEIKLEAIDGKIDDLQRSIDGGYKVLLERLRKMGKTSETYTKSVLEHHTGTVREHFSDLPYDSVNRVLNLDTVLLDVSIATSLVCTSAELISIVLIFVFFQVFCLSHEFRSAKSPADFVHSVYGKLISNQTSQFVQWKASGRKGDDRQGLSCLVNLFGVIGGDRLYLL